jgi:hypothetical protein
LDINGVIKSNANDARRANESLVIDSETQNLEANLIYGLSDRWQLDMQVAYIKHSGGSLDSLIQSWHDVFGLSDGDRPLFQDDGFQFLYIGDQGQANSIRPSGGLSDIRVGAGYSIKQNYISSLMVRFGVNLPTGSAEKLTGSDELDFDLGVYASGNNIGSWTSLGWHNNLGMVLVGDDVSFSIPTKNTAWFHSIGLSWELNNKWQVKGQVDSHSALFDSKISELSKVASQLTLGLAYETEKSGLIELYFSEDLTVNRAADFSIGIASRFVF